MLGNDLLDGHALLRANGKLKVGERRYLVGIREAVLQFVAQLADEREASLGEHVLVLHQYRHIVVVAEDGLELICFQEHRVVAHKVVVKRGLHHDALRPHERERDKQSEQPRHKQPVAQYPLRRLPELTVDFFDFHCCFYFMIYFPVVISPSGQTCHLLL